MNLYKIEWTVGDRTYTTQLTAGSGAVAVREGLQAIKYKFAKELRGIDSGIIRFDKLQVVYPCTETGKGCRGFGRFKVYVMNKGEKCSRCIEEAERIKQKVKDRIFAFTQGGN